MTVDQDRCPVCGKPNACEIAQGQPKCWCFHTTVHREIVDFLVERGLDDKCICQQCASGNVPSPCLGTCELDSSSEICLGCRRTAEEIERWASLGPVERAAVHFRLREASQDMPTDSS